jgi:hypothetical protein
LKQVIRTSTIDGPLVESVDDTLRELLSEQVRKAFYDHMETAHSLPRTLIPERLGDFQSVLSKTLGDTGREVLEKAIAKRLYLKLGLRFTEKHSYTLLQYVRDAEEKLRYC